MVDQREVNQRAAVGRLLGKRMAQVLLDAISRHRLDDLKAQDRFLAAKYLECLSSAENPAALLYSGMSSAQELEGYVASRGLESFTRENLIVASGSPNVRLHVVEDLPS